MMAVGRQARLMQGDGEDALDAKVMVRSASLLLPHLKSLNVKMLGRVSDVGDGLGNWVFANQSARLAVAQSAAATVDSIQRMAG